MRLLLITDDQATTDTFDLILRAAGHTVELTDSGEDGFELAKYGYDLIIVGDTTVDLTQIMTLRQIRDAKINTPVMVVSGYADVERKCRVFNLGADDYLLQPVHKDELVARVSALIRRSQGHATDTVYVGPLTITFGTGTFIEGRKIHLTGKEQLMLETMARRIGHTITKTAFMDALYSGSIDEPETKIVDVFLCKLRKKLRDVGADKLILTDWGRGYLLKSEPAAQAA